MANLSWCKRQKSGIRLVDPNDNLAAEYYASAEETLRDLNTNTNESNNWRAAKKYYAEYHAAYAILMKLGIRSEIHECTIALLTFLEAKQVILFPIAETLSEDKQLRIDNQYYLKNRPVSVDGHAMAKLLLNIKAFIDGLSTERVQEIRRMVQDP